MLTDEKLAEIRARLEPLGHDQAPVEALFKVAHVRALLAEVERLREIERQARLVRYYPEDWVGLWHEVGKGPTIEMRAWAELGRLLQPTGEQP